MTDETLLVVGILAGIAVMVVVLLCYQRGNERRLVAQAEIEIPIMSFRWSAATIVLSIVVGPVTLGFASAWSPSWFRQHAAVAVLSILVATGLFIPLGLWLTRKWRRVGVLRYAAEQLVLDMNSQHCVLHLDRPFELFEASAMGPGNSNLQVLTFRQDGIAWGFSYGLPITRKAYVNHQANGYLTPLLGAETRVIHDRIRVRAGPPTPAA